MVCVGSVKELEELTGATGITDIHRENVDHLTIPSKRPGMPPLKKIPEVFDCWFESGSMPYGQIHWPFDIDGDEFNKVFPADFIGEGLDQTRGWFYTLLVISTALFDDTPFKNLIVNGIVLAEDGKKMSKRLKNYPDPVIMTEKVGADAVRMYLANSGLVKAETLNFSEAGVKMVVTKVFLPWYHSYRFLLQNINRWETTNQTKFVWDPQVKYGSKEGEGLTNYTDKWVIAANQ